MSIWSDIQDRSDGTVRKEDFDIDSMLPKGVVHFKFKKKLPKGVTDESKAKIREAWGTKKMDIVDKVPHGGDCPPKRAGYTIYFDMEKGDWRAFLNDRIVYIEDKIYSEDEFFEKIYPTLVGDK
jgi:hypothetical protein